MADEIRCAADGPSVSDAPQPAVEGTVHELRRAGQRLGSAANDLSRRLPAQAADEVRHGSADFGRAVFLNEMDAFHLDLRLVRPRAAELAGPAVVEAARLGVEIQLGHLTPLLSQGAWPFRLCFAFSLLPPRLAPP
jgi:hypothetical protein